jgi:hypothetical protein
MGSTGLHRQRDRFGSLYHSDVVHGLFFLRQYLDGFGLAFMGTDAASFAKIVVDFITVIIESDGVIRTDIPAFTAVIAQFLIYLRSLVSPVAGFVVQGGSALNNGTFCEFHKVSFKMAW